MDKLLQSVKQRKSFWCKTIIWETIKTNEVFGKHQSRSSSWSHMMNLQHMSMSRVFFKAAFKKYSYMTWQRNKTWWASRRLRSFYGNGSQLLGPGTLLLPLLLFIKHLRGTSPHTVVHFGLLCHDYRLIGIHLEWCWGFQGIQGLGWKEAGRALAILGRGRDLGDDGHLDWRGGWGHSGGGGGGAARIHGMMLGLL